MAQYAIYSETSRKDLERLLQKRFKRSGDRLRPFQFKTAQCHIDIAFAAEDRADLARYGAPQDYHPKSITTMDVYDENHSKHVDRIPEEDRRRLRPFWDDLKNPLAFDQIDYARPLQLDDL